MGQAPPGYRRYLDYATGLTCIYPQGFLHLPSRPTEPMVRSKFVNSRFDKEFGRYVTQAEYRVFIFDTPADGQAPAPDRRGALSVTT